MRPAIPLVVTAADLQVLEQWIHSWDTAPVVRLRCQLIVLKTQGRAVEDIGSIVGMCTITVHHWIKRYRTEGISGLLTKPGRGRKKRLQQQQDAPAATLSIKEHRQSLQAAKAAYEATAGKLPVSDDTFRAFLKALATPIKESESGWVKRRTRKSTSTK